MLKCVACSQFVKTKPIGMENIRKMYLNGFSPFGLTNTVWKSTGNVITDHLSSSSSTSSVRALKRPGIPSKSSTCDWRDTFRVSVGFGHISEKKIVQNRNQPVFGILDWNTIWISVHTYPSNCSIPIANVPNIWSIHGNTNSFYYHIYSFVSAYIWIR